jgi:hypothetical protein
LVQATLEDKLKKSEELRSTFHHFLTEVAKAAENSKTGRPIPHKVLSEYTQHEAMKDAELQKVRLRHLMLKAQLAKIEHRVKQKVCLTLAYMHARCCCHAAVNVLDYFLLISRASQASNSIMLNGSCWPNVGLGKISRPCAACVQLCM